MSVPIPACVKVSGRLLKKKELKGYIKVPRTQRGRGEINFLVHHNFLTEVLRKPISCQCALDVLFATMSGLMI